MANEAKFVRGTQKTISTTIAALTNNAAPTLAGSYTSADTGDYPDAEFVLKIAFATAPTENSTIDLLVRAMNIANTTDDANAPDATYRPGYVGSFLLDNIGSSTTMILRCVGYDLPKEGDLYLFNNNTGQSSAANASLYMTPRTLGPAA